jgi:hypothetical protein
MLTEVEVNGKKSMRFRYAVIEEGTEQEKYLEVEKRISEDIDSFQLEVSPTLAENFGLQ